MYHESTQMVTQKRRLCVRRLPPTHEPLNTICMYHRHVGVALFGYNVTQKDDFRFSPWGECDEDTILLHYQRHPEILKRRFRRAVAEISICGVPLKGAIVKALEQGRVVYSIQGVRSNCQDNY